MVLLLVGASVWAQNDYFLFYEGPTGSAALYETEADGSLGTKTGTVDSWRNSWTDIEDYKASGEDMLLFYEKSTGSGTMYEVNASGGLGSVVHKTSNWRNAWSDIEGYSIKQKGHHRLKKKNKHKAHSLKKLLENN